MFLKHISILNYKNIEAAELELSPKLNCFIGNNGVGKTNFLDAVYYLSFCRSASGVPDSSVIAHDKDFFVVEGQYCHDAAGQSLPPVRPSETIYCGMKRGTKKHFKRNKKEYKRLSQHIGLVPLVMVSPSDVSLIEGSSEERRRLMDMVIAQYDHEYIEQLSAYNRALQQRNTLLKQEEGADLMLLDILEQQMAASGEALFAKRNAFISAVQPVFQHVYNTIAAGHEQVSLRYVSHCQRGPLLDVIQRDRHKDIAVGYSLHGAHRDDLEMLIGGYPIRREGSQGQNKTFALALKLAQFSFLKQTANRTTPLLLLDDIFDKLDSHRVEKIVHLVCGSDYGQIFITDTNRDHLDKILSHSGFDYKLFKVADGVISE